MAAQSDSGTLIWQDREIRFDVPPAYVLLLLLLLLLMPSDDRFVHSRSLAGLGERLCSAIAPDARAVGGTGHVLFMLPRLRCRRSLENRKGEFQIDSMNSVEDTKGNNGERGELVITNLRMIWYSARSRKTNLSAKPATWRCCRCV